VQLATARKSLANAIFASLVGATILAPGQSRAEADASADTHRSRAAVTVGGQVVTVGELEDRLAAIPPFQAATFGATKADIVKAYVDQVLVRDLLLGAGAEERHLDGELPTKHQLQRARSTATLRALRKGTPSADAIPAADVQRYYDENRSRFDSPERINLWRILCATREEADAVLAAAKREPTLTKYNDLAREHSIDKATNLRGGNLGFVGPDGASNEAGLKVDVGLVRAVSGVKDGEFAPQPIAEGSAFAVVWRRGTVPATRRTVEEASAQIRTTLYRDRTEGAEKKLIDDLRAAHVKQYNPDPLKIIEIPQALSFGEAGALLPRSPPPAKATTSGSSKP
jgi:peptidyl-prolyl cis-trans isomerase C